MMMIRSPVAVAVLAIAALVATVSPARATFPGQNGQIVFLKMAGEDIYLVNPFTLGETRITFGMKIDRVNFNAAANKIVAEKMDGGIVFVDPVAGAAPSSLPGGTDNDYSPSFSPDGTKVAFDFGEDIWVQGVDGSNRTNITNTPNVTELDPDWSADGSFVAFENLTDYHVWRIAPSGGGRTRLTPQGSCDVQNKCRAPSVFADGSRVAYHVESANAARWGIWSVLADGSSAAPFRISDQAFIRPAVSPDSTKVVVDGMYSISTDGSLATTQVATGFRPAWGAVRPAGGGAPLPVPAGDGTLNGTVRNAKGKGLKKFEVCAGSRCTIVTRKPKGGFSLTLPAGTHVLTARGPKYTCAPQTLTVAAGGTTTAGVSCVKA